jgi:hypothetical protein
MGLGFCSRRSKRSNENHYLINGLIHAVLKLLKIFSKNIFKGKKFDFKRIAEYFTDFWCVLEFSSIILFFLGTGVRFIDGVNFYLAARLAILIEL